MSNILYIAPYYNTDGWGEASRGYIHSLINAGHNLTIHPIYYHNNINSEFNDYFSRYESTKYDNYDCVIQKCIVGDFFYDSRYKKNIGITEIETNDWSACYESIRNINILDELWVPSNFEKRTLIKSGVKIPIKVISQPLDTENIKSNQDYKLKLPSSIENTFIFYTIGEFIERKNLNALITAFNLAFDYNDPVSLVIKTSISGKSSSEAKTIIEKNISTIKQKIQYKQKFKKELIITDRFSYKDIIGLHNACNCFVMTSYGEAFCRPAAEALVLGKTPVINKNTGSGDYIDESNGYLINSKKIPVLMNNRPLSSNYDFYHANQYWHEIDIYELIHTLKDIYHQHHKKEKSLSDKINTGISHLNNFSYESIGKKLCM